MATNRTDVANPIVLAYERAITAKKRKAANLRRYTRRYARNGRGPRK
jgi:hypothetical protein